MNVCRETNAGGYKIRLSEPSSEYKSVIYTLSIKKSEPFASEELMRANGFALVEIFSQNYTAETTPYPAKSPTDKGVVYEGTSGEFIDILDSSIISQAEKQLSINNPKRYFVGYSLGGLLAYSIAFFSNAFCGVGCVSASLWYENILSVSEEHTFSENIEKLYFSLGAKEANTKNALMATVAANTQKIYELTLHRGVKTVYETNPGGHFTEPDKRMIKAARWLTEQ